MLVKITSDGSRGESKNYTMRKTLIVVFSSTLAI